METVQLAISDAAYATALRELLERSGAARVVLVRVPDPKREGVIVVDSHTLGCLALPLERPERFVLITRNEPEQLSKAWNAGIRSVVFCDDPLNTAVLAILAAGLRRPRAGEGPVQDGSRPDRQASKSAAEGKECEPDSGARSGARRQGG